MVMEARRRTCVCSFEVVVVGMRVWTQLLCDYVSTYIQSSSRPHREVYTVVRNTAFYYENARRKKGPEYDK